MCLLYDVTGDLEPELAVFRRLTVEAVYTARFVCVFPQAEPRNVEELGIAFERLSRSLRTEDRSSVAEWRRGAWRLNGYGSRGLAGLGAAEASGVGAGDGCSVMVTESGSTGWTSCGSMTCVSWTWAHR